MKSYESIVKERMEQKVDSNLTGGLFRSKPYNHIFQKLEYNFIDGEYPVMKRLKGALPDSNIKYHYANHLSTKTETIRACEEMHAIVCDYTSIDNEICQLSEEMGIVAEIPCCYLCDMQELFCQGRKVYYLL